MTRTTLAIDDDVLRQIEERAAREGRTFQDVADELLRKALDRRRARPTTKLALRGWQATERPGVDLLDRDKLFERMARS